MDTSAYIRFFDEIGIEDVPVVGGKNASLGEMYQKLSDQGVRVPDGFAITASAYRHMLDQAGAWEGLHKALDDIDPDDVAALARKGKRAREIVYGAGLPKDLAADILGAYAKLQQEYGEDVSLAVRSSATAEDLPTASFAGQQDTYLNIKGEESLLDTCRRCFASLFTDRAIHYRIDQGFDHFKVSLSIGVMKMVRSDLAASGVMFSLDTESGFRDVVFITGAYGLGENVVQGAVDPDEFYVHKPTFLDGHRAVLRRLIGDKAVKMIFVEGDTKYTTRNIPTPKADRARFCITDEDALELAGYACTIEQHYGRPMDMEWAKDGIDGKLYIVQARPETVASQRSATTLESYSLDGRGEVLTEGRSVGEKIASGVVRRIDNVTHLSDFQPGEVLVSDTTTPDWEPVMKMAAAIVTNRGGRTCHAAIIARELGIPAVVGAGDATTTVPNGETVTVSCAEGDSGRVYEGEVPFHVDRTEVGDIDRPRTEIMINLGNPDLAFKTSFLPNDGVGLARMEFIINEYIKVHPLALLHPEKVDDPEARRTIDRLTYNYSDGAHVLRGAPVRGDRHDRGRLLAEARGGADVGLQVQRIRQPGRRNSLRARREQPDDRLPRGVALRPSRLRRGVCAGVPGDATRTRGDGPDERRADDPVRAPSGRGGPGFGGDGQTWSAARGERAQGVRDVRDPEQRDPHRRVRQTLRRLLHRIQRPHPAHVGRRPRQRDRGVRLRRARRRRQGDDSPGGGGLPPQRNALRAVRAGAVGLPGDGRVLGPRRGSTR